MSANTSTSATETESVPTVTLALSIQFNNSCRGSEQTELPAHECDPQAHGKDVQYPLEPVIHERSMIRDRPQ